mgnify:CR=1 FL=1
MDARITFDSDKARRFFRQVHTNVKEISQAHRSYVDAISVLVFQDVMDHFKREQGSDGKWKNWSKLYAERMAALGKGGNKKLQDSGRLRQSFMPKNYRAKSTGIQWYNPAKTKAGFPYAAAHDLGGDVLPKRDFMWLSNKALQRISQLTAEYMMKGL